MPLGSRDYIYGSNLFSFASLSLFLHFSFFGRRFCRRFGEIELGFGFLSWVVKDLGLSRMGKSPAKWIKTLLFGKKSGRSQTSKGRNASKAGNDRGYTVAKEPLVSAENSPVISEPVLVSNHSNGVNPELEKGKPSNLGGDGSLILPISQGSESQVSAGPGESNDPENIREEQAAIRAQAAFRGFLARRAFHALKGIIRLQALVRGHLVRRQAVATLRSMMGIVKLQALVRGQKVRSSTGLEVKSKFQRKAVVAKGLDSKKGKQYTNVFVCKLLSSSLLVMPLQIQYDQEEPNSVVRWSERWTYSQFWKPPSQLKKTLDSKPHTKRGSYAMETESGRPKRSVRRNSAGNVDSGPSNTASEPEKLKRTLRKLSGSTDSVPEHPQSELEKVKRNLRKVTSSMNELSDRPETEADKQSRSVRKVADPPTDIPNQAQGIDDSADPKRDIAITPEVKPEVEIASKPMEEPTDEILDDYPAVESTTFQIIDKEENPPVMNGEFSPKEEQTSNENHKTNKRRASFSAKPDYAENGVQSTQPLPSYMQATESAKAKLRGQNSPRLSSDSTEKSSAEKNGMTRRHSLPSSTNGKISSHSPRTQRLLQTSSKGGIRSDRSLLSSRDGNDKLIQVEWRR